MKHLTQGNLFRDSGEGKVVPDDIPGVLPVQRCEEDPELSEEGALEELVPTVHSSCLLLKQRVFIYLSHGDKLSSKYLREKGGFGSQSEV